MIANPFRKEAAQENVSLALGEYVVALASNQGWEELSETVLGKREKQYYQAVISLPFEDLNFIRTRYLQTLFALKKLSNKPGICMSERYAMEYLMNQMAQQNQTQMLTHPVLEQLKRIDAQRDGELYETLFQYLLHERSVLKGAEALHIHKNSFLYRMQRVREITLVDLDDPVQRNYLLLSYFLEKA